MTSRPQKSHRRDCDVYAPPFLAPVSFFHPSTLNLTLNTAFSNEVETVLNPPISFIESSVRLDILPALSEIVRGSST